MLAVQLAMKIGSKEMSRIQEEKNQTERNESQGQITPGTGPATGDHPQKQDRWKHKPTHEMDPA